MAAKIRLMRLGKMRSPHYRVVVADSRTKRDGRVIETIGKYHPKEEPSFIEIDKARALHWLGVGAQPTEAVEALLKVTGAWQEFKGLPAPEPMRVKEARPDKKAVFEAVAKAAMEGGEAAPRKSSAAKPDKAASAKVTAETGTNVQADPSTANVEAVTSEAEAAEQAEAAAPEATAAEAAAAEGGE